MHQIETRKFINNYVSVRSLVPLDRKTISAWNVLVWMMKAKTEKYRQKQTLIQAFDHAYSMQVRCGLTGYGNFVCIEFLFSYIQPDYIHADGYIEEVRKLMDQILFHPVLDESSLEEARWMLENRLAREKEDPEWCAIRQAFDALEGDLPVSVSITGTSEGIANTTLDDVKRCYEIWKEIPRCVYCIGTFSKPIMDFLESIDTCRRLDSPCALVSPDEEKTVRSSRPIAQSSLLQFYTTSTALGMPGFTPLYVLNSMLGSGQKSLLFDEVREKHSYCYSISSTLIRFDGLLVVTAGCKSEYIEDVLRLIGEQIDIIRNDKFDDELFEGAKLELIDTLVSQADRPLAQLETEWQFDLLDVRTSHEQQIEEIKKVTRRQVVNAARQLHLIVTSIVEDQNEDL